MARNILGEHFGLLTAQEYVGKYRYDLLVKCVCDCGNEKTYRQSQLTSGNAKSCGCLKAKAAKENSKKRGDISGEHNPHFRHGQANTKLHKVWREMKNRCKNQNSGSYKNYGARGITVCPEWEEFDTFFTWAIESGYKEGLSIDRIDNDKGYSPENCRWADWSQQMKNRRRSAYAGSKTVCVKCIETGIVYESVKEAAAATGAPVTSISSCLSGKLKHAGGYTWAKMEDES